MKPYYEHGGITIYHGDCREVLPELERAALLLTDPPWGVRANTDSSRFSTPASDWWSNADRSTQQRNGGAPVHGDDATFDPSHLLGIADRSVIWGGHCFADKLPPSPGWVVWDKRHGIEDAAWPLGEGELAWTDACRAVRIFRHRWMGLVRESEQGRHLHPTQKPVALMAWCIDRWSSPGDVILDPYLGSGPTLRAAKDLGRKAIGIEIEERYCEVAVKRLAQEVLPFPTAPARPPPAAP